MPGGAIGTVRARERVVEPERWLSVGTYEKLKLGLNPAIVS